PQEAVPAPLETFVKDGMTPAFSCASPIGKSPDNFIFIVPNDREWRASEYWRHRNNGERSKPC
ncbi:hypothetical protein, partial [Pseudomonas sp. 21C1]|uniref:hypothetical protein n=1 Tax=Pseudomonas sp. 21C1 TaxID=1843690 RepID=UPI001C4584C7